MTQKGWRLLPPAAALCATAVPASARDNGVSRAPPMGWNTWCTDGPCGPHPEDNCNDRELREMAQAMKRQGLLAAGWDRINLDDCWSSQDRDNATGRLVPVKDRFPDGLAPLITYLHQEGFKFGLYIDGGRHTCRGQVGSYGNYDVDAKAFAEWGVDYVKMDWCDSAGETAKEETAKWDAALNATGREMHYQCPCLMGRSDIGMGECNAAEPPAWLREHCNSWRFYNDHHDNWASTSGIIEALAIRAPSNEPFAYNDPDFLMTGGQGCVNKTPGVSPDPSGGRFCPGQTDDEYRTEMSIWCVTASPLLVATDLRDLTALQREVLLNKELIAVNQDAGAAAGRRVGFDAGCGATEKCQVWARALSDGSVAVVLHNADTAPRQITAHFADVGAPANSTVRDLWAHTDAGVHFGHYTHGVPAHGSAAVLLAAA